MLLVGQRGRDRMAHKLKGILENDDVFYQTEGDNKLTFRKNQQLCQNKSHMEFLSYLKSTCCHHKEQGDVRKVACKAMPLVESPMHHQLILTMRTQYDPRPNS